MGYALCSGTLAVCVLCLAGCGGGGGSDGIPGGGGSSGGLPPGSAPALLQASETSLTGYFRSALQRDASYAGEALAVVQPSQPGAVIGAAPDFSTTTLQEAGVDEADLVKTDGSVIYSIYASGTARSIRRSRIPAAGTALAQIGEYTPQLGSDVTLNGLYLDVTRKQLAALAGASFADYAGLWFMPQYWRNGATEVLLLDVSDPAATRARYKLRLDGQMVG